jgi:hypothetical protein
MQIAIPALDNGRVGIFARLVFKHAEHLAFFTVPADCEIERSTPADGVLVNEHHTTVLQGNGVDSRVGIR